MKFVSMRRRRYPRIAAALVFTLVFPHAVVAQQAPALPQGGQIVHGSAAISTPNGSTLQIDQASGRAVINWSDFSIGEGGLVNINQPGVAAALLNRVTGGNASAILGQLKANGQVYLINPQGIVVGPNGTIDTAAFVGSTLNTSDEAFLGGAAMRFAGNSNASVINVGTIRTSAGDVVIIAPRIANQGSIAAPAGTAALLAGQQVIYAPASTAILIKAPSQTASDAAIDNAGAIHAAEVQLRAAGSAHALAVNNGGVVSATSISNRGGRIVLDAGEGKSVSSGSLTATGTVGGSIDVFGKDVELAGGVVDASGATQGGTIRVGGGWQGKDSSVSNAERTTVASGVTLRANATETGNGGTIVNWADGHTEFSGAIEARGGAAGGNGGMAEVSGRETLNYRGRTDLRAPGGTTGTLLLDPGDLTINSGDAATIASDLNSTNVELSAYDNITVNAAITNSTTANTLTLEGSNIAVNANITLPQGSVTFRDLVGTPGALTSASGATINAKQLTVATGYPTVNFAGPVVTGSGGFSYDPTSGSPGTFTATNSSNVISTLSLTDGNFSQSGNFDLRSSVSMQASRELFAAGTVTLVSSGDLSFASGTINRISADGTMKLAATGGVFNSNGALTVLGSGRKLIYSSTNTGAYNTSGLSYQTYFGNSFPSDPLSSGNVIYIAAISSLPIINITADNKTMEYGTFQPTYTASFSGGSASDLTSAVRFQVSGSPVNVGRYAITPFGASSATHQLVYIAGTLEITPAPLLISGPTLSMSYGASTPAFVPTYTGFRNGDTPDAVFDLSMRTTATATSPVGQYPIIVSGARAANYTISFANGLLTISPATLRVIANNTRRSYGAANPLFSATISGLMNGDSASVVSGLTFATAAGERSNVGAYPITVTGGTASNYVIEGIPGTLTIDPAPLTVSTSGASVTYGEPIPTLLTFADGLVAGDTIASLGIGYLPPAAQGSNVGVYAPLLTGNLSNYRVDFRPATITITPRPLTITAASVKRFQYEENPAFTASVNGLYGTDTVWGLHFDTEAVPSSPSGRYFITPSVDANPNYLMQFEPGTLTVEQLPPAGVVEGQAFNTSLPNFLSGVPTGEGISIRSNSSGLDGLLVNARSVVLRALEPLGDVNKYLHLLRRSEMPGDHSELGKVLPFLLAEADTILKKTAPWTAEETAFIEQLTSTISAQRKAAAEQAQARVEAWKRDRQAENEKQGQISTISVTGVPPQELLQQAQAGVALDENSTLAFAATLAAAASLASDDGTTRAIVASTVATTVMAAAGATFSSVALMVGIKVAAGKAGWLVGNIGWTMAAAGASSAATVAVLALMAAAAIKTGVEVANMGDYDRDLAAAVAAAQRPTTVDDLRAMLATADGQQRAFHYLTADLANNTSAGGK